MGKIPVDLRTNVATNIRNCRNRKYPQWGGAKRCAADFGVSPQQWSQWECGIHMPDEFRMIEIAAFFSVSTEYLRRDNRGDISFSRARDGTTRIRKRDIYASPHREEPPLKVEVERITEVNLHQLRSMAWHEVIVTLERKC